MKAWIDNENRAIVEVNIASHAKAKRQIVNAWIDTAFDGYLVMPKSEIESLCLKVLADTDAILADGTTTRLRCYYCVVDWLDQGSDPVGSDPVSGCFTHHHQSDCIGILDLK